MSATSYYVVIWKTIKTMWPAADGPARFLLLLTLLGTVIERVVMTSVPMLEAKVFDFVNHHYQVGTFSGIIGNGTGSVESRTPSSGLIGFILSYFPEMTSGISDDKDLLMENEYGINPVFYGVFKFVLFITAFKILGRVGCHMREMAFHRVRLRVEEVYADTMFSNLLHLSMNFHTNRDIAEVTQLIHRGSAHMLGLAERVLFNTIPLVLQSAFQIGYLLYMYDIQFTFVFLVVLVVFVVWSKSSLNSEVWPALGRKCRALKKKKNKYGVERMLNVETVKLFCHEEADEKGYLDHLQQQRQAVVDRNTLGSFCRLTSNVIHLLGSRAIRLLALYRVTQGTMGPADFVLVSGFIDRLWHPLNQLTNFHKNIKEEVESCIGFLKFITIDDFLDETYQPRLEFTPREKKKKNLLSEFDQANFEIEFKNVHFSYPKKQKFSIDKFLENQRLNKKRSSEKPEEKSRDILNGISFKICSGQQIGLVGETGSGKSTIAKLLFRFYDPTEGEITINGVNIKDIELQAWRKFLGVVPQDCYLFNATIKDNIAFGADGPVDETSIVNAANAADIHQKILKFTKKYETVVGERGMKLSGGEKQRVAIARVLLKKSPFLIFDESSSSLDSVTEKKIWENIHSISKDKTTVSIAHRLQTVKDSDCIFVINEGQVLEFGTHENLLSKKSEYYRLWNSQQKVEHGCVCVCDEDICICNLDFPEEADSADIVHAS